MTENKSHSGWISRQKGKTERMRIINIGNDKVIVKYVRKISYATVPNHCSKSSF